MFAEGKVAIITGIGPGMGRRSRWGSPHMGVNVGAISVVSTTGAPTEAVAAEVRARSPAIGDFERSPDREANQGLAEAAIERFGGIDFLVQNAHHEGHWTTAVDADPDSWRQGIRGQPLRRVASGAGGSPGDAEAGRRIHRICELRRGPFASAQNGLVCGVEGRPGPALSAPLALEVGRWGIRVNGVFLGATQGETLNEAAKQTSLGTGLTPQEATAAEQGD